MVTQEDIKQLKVGDIVSNGLRFYKVINISDKHIYLSIGKKTLQEVDSQISIQFTEPIDGAEGWIKKIYKHTPDPLYNELYA